MPFKAKDLIFLGGGPRATAVVTAMPELLDWDVSFVTDAMSLGPGRLGSYNIPSNSIASDFLTWIDQDGPFGSVLKECEVADLRLRSGNLRLIEAGRLLQYAGDAIVKKVGTHNVTFGVRVSRIDICNRTGLISLASGRELIGRARHLALATGIREHRLLDPAEIGIPVHLSGAVLANSDLLASLRLALAKGKHVVVVGGSHSAASIVVGLVSNQSDVKGTLTLASRHPFKFFYPDRATLERDKQPYEDVEAIRAPTSDGPFNRYSGLRFEAATTIRTLIEGRFVYARAVQNRKITKLMEIKPDVIIQACGYVSDIPQIVRGGQILDVQNPDGRIRTTGKGRVHDSSGDILPISAVGLLPNPTSDDAKFHVSFVHRIGRELHDTLMQLSPKAKASVAL